MTLPEASLVWLCACLPFTALVAATAPARVHEARQGPISTTDQPLSISPAPNSSQPPPTTTTTATDEPTTTMSPTSSSEQFSSSEALSSPLTTTPNALFQPSDTRTRTSSSSSPSATSTSSLSASSTSSDTPQPSSSSPGFLSFAVHNMTTCTPGLISWTYGGNEAELLLSVSNIGVNQSLSRRRRRQVTIGTIQEQLANTNTSVSSWTWPSVNVTQGWYEIQGLTVTAPAIDNTSAPFFVANGTDVSCLTGTGTSSTTSPSASISSVSAVSKTNVGAIVAGVIGGVVSIALSIVAAVCLWTWRRRKSFAGVGKKRNRNWGSLKSTDSNVLPTESGTQLSDGRFHGRSESTAGVLEDIVGGKTSASTTPGDSDEDTAMGEEKLVSPASSSGMSPFDALNTPVHYDRRSSAYHSTQTTSPVVAESSRSRSASLLTSNQSIEQQAQRIRSSMETSTRRRSERLSTPTLPSPSLFSFSHSPIHTHNQSKEEYPLSSVSASPVNRSVSTGAVSIAARRASRKPVPQYNPSVLLEDANTDTVSTFTAGAESSQSHGTGMGTGTSGMPTDLRHKASFGDGRPMHYLIPDMPLPQQD